jgi:hypothetical protein
MALYRKLGLKWDSAKTLHNLSAIAMSTGNLASARALQEESLGLRREMEDKPGIASSLSSLGEIAGREGTMRLPGPSWKKQ